MAEILPEAVVQLIAALGRLPGVGRRTATRYALDLLRNPHETLEPLVSALGRTRSEVRVCTRCRGLAGTSGVCAVCDDPRRDSTVVCVIESVPDLLVFERSAAFHGRYFILHGLLSPLKGIGPDELGLELLEQMVVDTGVRELVLAVPMTADGETTATFIRRMFGQRELKMSRLATGVPVGGTLEFLDQLTLSRALEDRREL